MLEYSIYINYRCNLRCNFCYVKEKLSNQSIILTDRQINQIINYISKDHSDKEKIITFLGGEPLLDYKIIEKFIKKTKKFGWLYSMYTNGLLLNNVPLNVLKLFDIILVSVDGDKKAQEKYRGPGTYEKVINNIKAIKPKLNSLIIGRITLTEKTNIYKSSRNLLNYVDAIHWQIVNKAEFEDSNRFIKNYKKGIEKLLDLWLSNLKKGRLLKIIPFQAITASLIFNYPKNNLSFRCGAGHDLKTIDVDGNIYWCDEYVGNKKALVGNVKDFPKLKYKKHTEIFDDCKKCDISDICRGRCRKCLEEYSTSQVRNYCKLTKILVNAMSKKKKEIERIAKNKKYKLSDFINIPDCTEEIP